MADCGCGKCKDCKKVHEHLATVLPFRIVEAVAGKPLRIAGVAMATGISRNFAVYTSEELENLAPQMVGAPIYIEHVGVNNATGKVTNAYFDKTTKQLMYEGEIYDQAVAEKIRNGLIQHVSVGADYESIDEFNAHAFHGLSKPELSLVAVPGFPEANIRVLERLVESASRVGSKVKLHTKELLQDLQCVFCGAPGEYLVSVCTSCGDNAQSMVKGALEHLPVKEMRLAVTEAEGEELPTLFSAFKVRFVASPDACAACKALDGKEFIYGQEPQTPHDGCKCPGYRLVERLIVHVTRGAEKLEDKDLEKLAEKTAAKVNEKASQQIRELQNKLAEAEEAGAAKNAQVARSQKYGIGVKAQNSNVSKPENAADVGDDLFGDPVNYRYPLDPKRVEAALSYFNKPENRAGYSAEEQVKVLARIVGQCLANGVVVSYQADDPVYKALPEELKGKLQGYKKEQSATELLAVVESKVKDQDKLLEKYRKVAPGVELTTDSPVLMPVSEAIKLVESVLPATVVERAWGLGPQRMVQETRRVVNTLRVKAGGA